MDGAESIRFNSLSFCQGIGSWFYLQVVRQRGVDTGKGRKAFFLSDFELNADMTWKKRTCKMGGVVIAIANFKFYILCGYILSKHRNPIQLIASMHACKMMQ